MSRGLWPTRELPCGRSPADTICMIGQPSLKLALILGCIASCVLQGDAVASARSSGPSTPEQTRLLLSDMSNPSERMPAGVPSSFDWAGHPRARPDVLPGAFRAFTAWGQLYQCVGPGPAPRGAVDLKDLQAWVLLRNFHGWRRIQFSSDLSGGAFADDYAGPTVKALYSASPQGTIARLIPEHNFHFWPRSGRVSLDSSDVAAVTVAVEARLEPTAARVPASCLVLSVGGDMWTSLSAAPGGSASADVGIGRFKRVERRWRLFTMTTASTGVLGQMPVPPIAPRAEDF
jgi:hypothetical protein